MPPTLPDDADAWVDTWRERLNDSAAFAEAADGFDAAVLFAIRPDDSFDGEPVRILVDVADGECVAAETVESPDGDYDYALRGPYGAWKALLQDDIDAANAVMDGPFDLEGSTLDLMQYRTAFAEMIGAARDVDVRFAY